MQRFWLLSLQLFWKCFICKNVDIFRKKPQNKSQHFEMMILKKDRQKGQLLVFAAPAAVNSEDAQEH